MPAKKPVRALVPKVTAIVRDEKQNGSPYVATPEGLALVQRWAAEGGSNAWIAAELGISRDSFAEMRRRQPELADALAAGRAADEHAVANVLRKKAMAGDTVAMLFYLKARHGWKEGDARDAGAGQVNVQVIQLAAPMTPEQYRAHVDAEQRARQAADAPPVIEGGGGGDDGGGDPDR